jgi:hypothetical protein
MVEACEKIEANFEQATRVLGECGVNSWDGFEQKTMTAMPPAHCLTCRAESNRVAADSRR